MDHNRFYGISQRANNRWFSHTSANTGFRTNQWFHSIAFDGNTTWVGGLLALYEMRDGKVVNTYDVNPLSTHCIVTAIAFDQTNNYGSRSMTTDENTPFAR